MTTVVEQMLSRYPRETDAQTTHALREVMQEIALAGLNRGGFFRINWGQILINYG